ncbi:RHS repeat domain-containing protein [Kolteria novifilia]|uniref:RHS repeat domain-containing protein n=1 Tax=Kolteria novifilia TaxID=2527975 RepID=UPI003AF36FAF
MAQDIVLHTIVPGLDGRGGLCLLLAHPGPCRLCRRFVLLLGLLHQFRGAVDLLPQLLGALVGRLDLGSDGTIDELTWSTYDENDRLLSEITDLDGDAIPDPAVNYTANWTYDAAHQIQTATDRTSPTDILSSYDYDYDKLGRVTTIDNDGTPGPNVILNQEYDPNGNRTQLSATIDGAADFTNSYAYDELNRMTSVTQSGPNVAEKRVDFAYDGIGQFTQIDRYSDLVGTTLVASSTYGYDTLGRLESLAHVNGSGQVINTYTYTFDALNRIDTMTSIDGTVDYTYDEEDQLTAADHVDAIQSDESYVYDANGNRLDSHRTPTDYDTGPNNQLLDDGVYTYAYDDEGNRTSRTEIATGEVTEYTWDHRNRLTRVISKDDQDAIIQDVLYAYDIANRRIAKEIDWDGAGTGSEETERYILDQAEFPVAYAATTQTPLDSIVLVYNDATDTQTRFLHGPDIDQVLAEETVTEVVWSLPDHQGSIRDLVVSDGQVTEERHVIYNAFGEIIDTEHPISEIRFAFTGREYDAETGQYYYRARYYDVQNGRFIAEDPMGVEESPNLSAYAHNSPIGSLDPSGMIRVSSDPRNPTFVATGIRRCQGRVPCCGGSAIALHVFLNFDDVDYGIELRPRTPWWHFGNGPAVQRGGREGNIYPRDRDQRPWTQNFRVCEHLIVNPYCYDLQRIRDALRRSLPRTPSQYSVIGSEHNCITYRNQLINDALHAGARMVPGTNHWRCQGRRWQHSHNARRWF